MRAQHCEGLASKGAGPPPGKLIRSPHIWSQTKHSYASQRSICQNPPSPAHLCVCVWDRREDMFDNLLRQEVVKWRYWPVSFSQAADSAITAEEKHLQKSKKRYWKFAFFQKFDKLYCQSAKLYVQMWLNRGKPCIFCRRKRSGFLRNRSESTSHGHEDKWNQVLGKESKGLFSKTSNPSME